MQQIHNFKIYLVNMSHYTKRLGKIVKALNKASRTHKRQAQMLDKINKDQSKRYNGKKKG